MAIHAKGRKFLLEQSRVLTPVRIVTADAAVFAHLQRRMHVLGLIFLLMALIASLCRLLSRDRFRIHVLEVALFDCMTDFTQTFLRRIVAHRSRVLVLVAFLANLFCRNRWQTEGTQSGTQDEPNRQNHMHLPACGHTS